MTASTPPLVDVIAEALYDDSNTRQMGPPWSEYIKTSSRVDYWRDKARAVLDALTKAGGMSKAADEWLTDAEVPPVFQGQISRESYNWRGKRIEG